MKKSPRCWACPAGRSNRGCTGRGASCWRSGKDTIAETGRTQGMKDGGGDAVADGIAEHAGKSDAAPRRTYSGSGGEPDYHADRGGRQRRAPVRAVDGGRIV